MVEDWPALLLQFSLSVDVVDDEIFENIKDAVEDYLLTTLDASSFRVLIDVPGHDGGAMQALDTVWSSRAGRTPDIPLLDADGECNGPIVETYLRGTKRWTVGDPETATEVDHGIDGWSVFVDGDADDRAEGAAGTSIVLPLDYAGDRRFGVVELRFHERLSATRRGKQTTEDLADALSRLISLNNAHTARVEDTRDALERLRTSRRSHASPMEKRIVFVSSGATADPMVVDAITDGLRQREGAFGTQTLLWSEQTTSGNINDQVRDALSRCEFGICYLSEPAIDRPGHYIDNPNVLFEAGMLQMLHELRDSAAADYVSRWIPVREADAITDPLPFNFSNERTVQVPRDDTGVVRSEELALRVGRAIDSMARELDLR